MMISEKRWLCGFVMALNRMQDVWVRAGGLHGDSDAQGALAKLLTVNPCAADRLIKREQGNSGFSGMESHIKELLVMLYWGQLWRMRRPRKPTRAGMSWTVGGWDDDLAASALNECVRRMFPKWQDWGWEMFTPRRVRSIADAALLERMLPDGWL
jgi:hypothetical protein